MSRVGAVRLFAAAIALAATACKDTTDPLDLAGDPEVITVASGNAQTAGVGLSPTDSLVVLVVDASDRPVPGVPVTWATTGGTVSPAVSQTNAAGLAATRLTLPASSGTVTVTATAQGLDPVTFTATASPFASGTLAFRYVDAGSYHACGITTDERSVCWGFNGDGQLMAGSGENTLQPTAAVGNLTFRITSGGRYHSCGVTLSGTVWCAGANHDGRLLNKSQEPSNIPVQGGSPITMQMISAGYTHTCALGVAQDLWCGGNNQEGEIGSVTVNTHSDTLRRVDNPNGFLYRTVSAGGLHSCALNINGTAECWGYNRDGQLGAATAFLQNFQPVLVSGGLTFRVEPNFVPRAPDPDFYVPGQAFLSAGYAHTCGVVVNGSIFCWGLNEDGQLGRGGAGNEVPQIVASGGRTYRAVSAGFRHTCALDAAGGAWCWGNNDLGQLGNGTTAPSSAPVAVSGGLVFQSISAGETFSCGVTATGVAYCWGDNEYGQLGVTAGGGSLVPVKVAFQP